MPTPIQDLTGQVIASQFRVLHLLGKGGMGTVYLAEQLHMDRRVVIKLLHPELHAGSSDAVARFKREAKAIARLNHPNIVQVHVFGELEGTGQLYLVMEHIDGHTLTDGMVAAQPMPVARALRIADQICSALVEAHGAGLVHRDLKPDNVMLTIRHGVQDYVKVLDFGIAHMRADPEVQTAAGALFGTPRYMSPEQGAGKPVDARSDLYSLGVMLHELLTGEHPFDGRSTLDFLMKHQSAPVTPPSERFPSLQLPPRVERLVMGLLEKRADDRPVAAAEVQREVRLALRDLPEAVRPWPTPGPRVTGATAQATPKDRGRSARWIPLVAAGLIAGVGTLLFLASRGPDERPGRSAPNATLATTAQAPTSAALTGRSQATASAAPSAAATSVPASAPPTTAAPATAAAPPSASPDPEPPALAAGPDQAGFPAPAGCSLQAETPQALVLQCEASPIEVRAFYKTALTQRGIPFQLVGQGLQIPGEAQRFSGVWFAATAAGTMTSVTRNPFHPDTQAANKAPRAFLGVLLPNGMRTTMRTPKSLVATARLPVQAIVRQMQGQLGRHSGVNVVRSPDGRTLSATRTRPAGPRAWHSVTVQPDPQRPNHTMISVFGGG